MPIGQPFDCRFPPLAVTVRDNGRIGFVGRLALNIAGEKNGIVGRRRIRAEIWCRPQESDPGKRRRTSWRGVALDDDDVSARFARR